MKYSFLLLGILFGFLLSRAGATTYDYYANLFLLKDFQLLWVIATAVLVGVVGMFLLKRSLNAALMTRELLQFVKRPMRRGLVFGALLFGVGWGIAGSCPGTAPAMLGEGKLMALFSVLGIGLGTWLYGRHVSGRKRDEDQT